MGNWNEATRAQGIYNKIQPLACAPSVVDRAWWCNLHITTLALSKGDIMKWFEIAKLVMPILGVVVPGAAPLVPMILGGITEAEQINGADGPAKRAHVMQLVADGAQTATATGKVTIDPTQAQAITASVFSAVDAIHQVVTTQVSSVPNG